MKTPLMMNLFSMLDHLALVIGYTYLVLLAIAIIMLPLMALYDKVMYGKIYSDNKEEVLKGSSDTPIKS